MGLLDDPLKLADRDPGVAGGGLDAAVAQQLLDVTDVGPALEQMRRAGVTQRRGPRPWTASRAAG